MQNVYILMKLCNKIIRYVGGRRCSSKVQLQGKTVIITGGNTGIGKETAIDLAKRKARVILACRSEQRGETAAAEIRKITKNNDVIYRHLDLASLALVRQFCEKINREEKCVDILINNAGLHLMKLIKTEDGYETMFAVNHLGHFLLTLLLLDKVKAAKNGRIIVVAAKIYEFFSGIIDFDNLNVEKKFSATKIYAQSKLANILFTRCLAKRLKDEGSRVTINCLHPGVIYSEFARYAVSGLIEVSKESQKAKYTAHKFKRLTLMEQATHSQLEF